MLRVTVPKRFELLRCLGEGGMGVVFEARDRERGAHVALKMLRSPASDAIVRFKREFRLLKDLHNPNIVRFGELVSEGDDWFFTMELVLGETFLGYVCDTAGRSADHASARPTLGALDPDTVRARLPDTPRPPASGPHSFDEGRLRSALRQLAAGLRAVHDAGLVHSDIKPSNIRVTGEGRVVLLDFGLVREVDAESSLDQHGILGTPGYMAPEQAAGAAPGPESDWYSVGILLHEALTGNKPFSGAPLAVLEQKQQEEARAPGALVPGVPADLDALCVALLRRDAGARPVARDVLRALGAPETVHSRSLPSSVGFGRAFVGRERELEELRRAFDDASDGEAVQVLVCGESGIGKTCLVKHFLELMSALEPSTLALTGRCYERESVPYKAFDGVVDALAQALMRLDDGAVLALLPPRVEPLLQIFPVLRMVRAIAALARDPLRIDPLELRSRAFVALRELLTRIAERRRLVVTIDDAQWGDDDSRVLLADLLRPPRSPSLLLIATMRTGHQGPPESQPRLHTDRDYAAPPGELVAALPVRVRTIELRPFSLVEGRELAALLLGGVDSTGAVDAGAIAQEAGGHPLFIDALVRHHALPTPGGRARGTRLEDALLSRIAALDEVARRIMEAVAVGGGPVALNVLAIAVPAAERDLAKQIALLRAEHMLQRSPRGGAGFRGDDAVDVYHDRIRAAVLARLEPDARKGIHRHLAQALEASSGLGDAEALAIHWRGAGDPERAATHAATAADQAAHALAFDRAARLYRLAVRLHEPSPEQAGALWAKLGDALANSGHGALAARAFQTAAGSSPGPLALELHRRAAEQLLRAGHFDEGLAAIRVVLASCGMRLPRTPQIALLLFFLWRLFLRVRGLDFREREASQVSPLLLTRIDVSWSVAMGLAMVDNIRGATFQARHLVLALRAGEPVRVARALALEVAYLARGGGATWRRTEALMHRALQLAERTGRPEAIGFATATGGFAHHISGKFRLGLELLDRSLGILRDECTGMSWEIASAQSNAIMCLAHLGELKELCRRRSLYIRDAIDRGDLYAAVNLRIGSPNLAWLVQDDPDAARAEAEDAMRQWSKQGFHIEHYLAMIARVNADLYSTEGVLAHAFVMKQWPKLRRSLLLTVQVVRISAHWARGRCAIAAAEVGSPGLAIAEADARALERERWGWSVAMASQLRAGIAMVRRDARDAARLLEDASASYAREDMALHAAAARRCLGGLLGGDRGRALIDEADQWMASQGVRDPARFAAVFAPGFGRSS